MLSNELPKLNKLKNLKHLKTSENHCDNEEMQEFQLQNLNIKIEHKTKRIQTNDDADYLTLQLLILKSVELFQFNSRIVNKKTTARSKPRAVIIQNQLISNRYS